MNEAYQTIRNNFIQNEELKRLEELKNKYANFQQPNYSTMSTHDELQTRFDLDELNSLQQKYGTQQQSPTLWADMQPYGNQPTYSAPTQAVPQQSYGWARILQDFKPISADNAHEYQPQTTMNYETKPAQYGDATAKALDNYLKDYKIPEWPSYFGPLAPVIDFGRNYATMRWKDLDTSDKFFHCKANYEATSRGPSGVITANILDILKEIKDIGYNKYPISDSIQDYKANLRGQIGALQGKTLEETCPTYYKDYE